MTHAQSQPQPSPRFLRLGRDAPDEMQLLGPLADLVGTWVGSQGWNIVAVPVGRAFRLLVRPYLETITFILKNANTTAFRCTFWIETIQDPATGVAFQQLQYSQQTDIEFLPRFGDPTKLIMWPHVNVNTLKKQ